MTLSTWLRDYLYIPLGGTQVAPVRAYFNLGLTMFLVGLWHGAAWTFVIYGLLQATAMLTHRYVYRRSGRARDAVDASWLHVLKILGTLHFVVLSRILFRSSDLHNAGDVAAQLLQGIARARARADQRAGGAGRRLCSALHAARPVPPAAIALHRAAGSRAGRGARGLGGGLMLVASEDVVPYIYFQF